MKTTFCLILAIVLPVQVAFLSLEAKEANSPQLLLKWRDGPESTTAFEGNKSIGSTVKHNFNALNWQLVELPPGMSEADGVRTYQTLASVLAVERNRKIPITLPPAPRDDTDGRRPLGLIPNDPKFNQQWYLKIIGMTNAWATTTGNSNVVVAVIDSGVNYRHQDLWPNMWRNPGETGLDANGHDKATNGIDDDEDGYVDDVYGIDVVGHDSDPIQSEVSNPHGTACASIIGAAGGDGKGMVGVNWHVSIMVVRAINPTTTTATLLEAHEYLLQMKKRGVNIRAVNMSYGYGSWALSALKDAHEALGNAGILQVCGAANNGYNLESWPSYPQSWRLPSMIIVGGSDPTDRLWSSSNYGWNTVDLVAPSVQITAAAGPGTNAYDSNFAGNSFSGPQVAGAAALLLAAQPDLTMDEIKAALFGSVDQKAAFIGKAATGGRLNVGRAMEYLTNANPPAIVVNALPRGQLTPIEAPIQVTFNRPMNRASVESALVISPPVNGTFEWATDSRSFSYNHVVPFDISTNYGVRILATAQDQMGQPLDGNYSRVYDGSPADDFSWNFAFPLPNDEFTNAQVVAGFSGSITGDNRHASVTDQAEVDMLPGAWSGGFGSSLWYRWTVPEAGGWCTFDLTSGTSFDSLLAVYSGKHLDGLTMAAANDDYGMKAASRVSFATEPGTDYSVFVASKYDADPLAVGAFRLAWYPTPPPGFTSQQLYPVSGALGSKVTLYGTNFTGATAVLFNGASATFTNWLTNYLDLRITAVVPPDAISGLITVVTPHGSATTSLYFQVPPPSISMTFDAATGLHFRWPGTNKGWLLEETQDLIGGTWNLVPQAPVISAAETTVSLPIPAGMRFYRLRRG